MAGEVTVKISGLAEAKKALLEIAPNLRRRAIRNALAAGARVYRDAARKSAPVLDRVITRNGLTVRKPGTLRDAIAVRTSKIAKRAGDLGVFVNVRPAKGAAFKTVRGRALFGLVKTKSRVQTRKSKRGALSPDDPFYWRFLEFGTAKMSARPFLRPAAANKGDEALKQFERTLGPAIQRLNK